MNSAKEHFAGIYPGHSSQGKLQTTKLSTTVHGNGMHSTIMSVLW